MDNHKDILSELIKEYKHFGLTDRYNKILETDQECIFTCTLNVMKQKYNIVPVIGMPKNAKESEKLREQGNELFVKGGSNNITCIDALKLYAKAITFAPYQSEELALAYANRSIVLFKLGLHTECIQDIDRALTLNYPDNLRAKLYIRKTECLMILGNHSVENTLEKAQYWLDKISLKDQGKIKEKLRTKIQVLQRKTVQTESSTQDTPIQLKTEKSENETSLIVSYNNEVPCASDAVAIKYNKRYGRHVVATRNIRPGEVIAVEKPYSLLLSQDNMQTHCSNCLQVSWANIPCKYCTYVMYCSEECRYYEWKKCHDVECAVFPPLIKNGCPDISLFGMRLAMLALKEAGGIQELKAMLKKVDECDDLRTKGFFRDGKLHSFRYSGIYGLMTNVEKRTDVDLAYKAVYACWMLYFLATRTTIFGAKLPGDLTALAINDDVRFFGGFILRNLFIISCNTHTFVEAQGLECPLRGLAAMPFFSLINHSCDPNVSRQSRPKHIVLYAHYPIKEGEQILINYGYEYAAQPRAERREHLLRHCYFTCDCVPCQENWPIQLELQSYEILVKKPENGAKIKEMLKEFHYFDLVRGAMTVTMQNKSYMIENMLKMIQMLHNHVPMPYTEMNNLIKMLRKVYDLNGNRFDIPQIYTCQQ